MLSLGTLKVVTLQKISGKIIVFLSDRLYSHHVCLHIIYLDTSTSPTRLDTSPDEISVTENVTAPTNGFTDKEPEGSTIDETEGLTDEVLKAMGKRICPDKILGISIPKSIVVRWEEIFKQGLPTEEKTALLKKYPPPSNCDFIEPPKLNAELKATTTDANLKRDARIVLKQEKIAACIAAQGKAITLALQGNGDAENLMMIEYLSDTSRLLADLQREESSVRKSLILAPVNAAVKDVLQTPSLDGWLCGKDLDERLKSAKTLERSLKDLKPPPKFQNSKAKNFKTPPRYPQPKGQASTFGGQKYSSQKRASYPKPIYSQKTYPSHQRDKTQYRKEPKQANRQH